MEKIDIRQVVYMVGINGKISLAQEMMELIDDMNIKTMNQLRYVAENMGVNVTDDMPPSVILEEMVAIEQYAKYH